MLKLGVNIDHVATLREARYRGRLPEDFPKPEPDLLEAARVCARAGAHGITLHVREDRRHAQDHDLQRLVEANLLPINLEMAVHPNMEARALEIKPAEVCLVPENRAEVTTEGGLEVAGQLDVVRKVSNRLSAAGIRVSLFIDPDPRQVEAAAAVGAPCIELHTGAYANATPQTLSVELDRLRRASEQAHALGLQVNAGHGLRIENLPALLRVVPHLHTLNIGHSIISLAVFCGLEEAVRAFLKTLQTQK